MNEKKGVIDRLWKNHYIIELDDHTIVKYPIGDAVKWKDGDRIIYGIEDGKPVLKKDEEERNQIKLDKYFKK